MISRLAGARRRGKTSEEERAQIEHALSTSGGKVTNGGPGYVMPPSRRNRRSLTTWQEEAAIQALKEIGVTHGRTMQALIAEGINQVLVKYGKAPLADEN